MMKKLLMIAVLLVFTAAFCEPLLAASDVFSVNFYAYGRGGGSYWDQEEWRETVRLEPYVSAGFGDWNTTGWANVAVPWGMDNPASPVTITSNQGFLATFALNDVRNGSPYYWDQVRTTLLGDGNGNMMDGHANGTEDPYDGTSIFDMTVSDIPYSTYDVIIYMGANAAQFGNGTGKIVFNGGPEQDFTLKAGIFDGTFTEIVDSATAGNYIVFEGVTGSSFSVQVWGNGLNHIAPCGFQVYAADTTGQLPEDEILLALTELKEHLQGTISLNDSEIAAHKATIDADKTLFGLSENVMTAAFDLVETYDTIIGPLFVSGSPIQSFSRSSASADIHWTAYNVMQNIIDWTYTNSNVSTYQALFDGFKFGSSAFFPGAVNPPTDPEVGYDVEINATAPEFWGKRVAYSSDPVRRPTGCYLAPGSIGEVTVPPAMVNQGFEILVGAHTWDKSNKSTIKRLDRITNTFSITSETTSIANPFGGGIYIIVPYRADLGVVTIQISNVVRSPFFSATSTHQTTLQEWTGTERHHPGPWADFESDKFMMQVPTSWIYNYADPVTQMQKWDMAMDGMSELLGHPLVRNRTVLYVQPDTSIAHGAYGIGYPQVNQIYNPDASTNGNSSHIFLTNPIGSSTTYHELGHAQLFSKFPGHTESMVNLPYVYIATEKFGVDLVEAFTKSMGLAHLKNISVDQAALTWFVTENFRNGNPMNITNSTKNEVRYQHRGYGRYVDMAVLFGWDVISDFYRQEHLDYMAGTPGDGLHSVDSRILRFSKAAGVDLTPLIHCWGVHPVNLPALQAAIAAEGLSRSSKIYDRLVHYKEIIPADNTEFWDHYTTIYPSQPGGGNPDYQYGWYNVWKNIYDETHGTAAKNAMQDIIDLYFPDGRPGVNIREDMITWSGKAVRLNPVFNGGYSATSFTWTAEPAAGVVFSPNENVEAPTVTVTKATANPSVVTIKLITDGPGGLQEDTMTLDVYDTACKGAIGNGLSADHPTDLDGNCITNLADFAVMATIWLTENALTEPVAK